MAEKINTKKELIEAILSHGDDIRSFGITRLGIFGSFVRDEANEDSDVDLFIELPLEYKTLKNFYAMSEYFQKLTGRRVELVTPESLNKFIGKYILQEVEYVTFAA